jgi:hypothetical protein
MTTEANSHPNSAKEQFIEMTTIIDDNIPPPNIPEIEISLFLKISNLRLKFSYRYDKLILILIKYGLDVKEMDNVYLKINTIIKTKIDKLNIKKIIFDIYNSCYHLYNDFIKEQLFKYYYINRLDIEKQYNILIENMKNAIIEQHDDICFDKLLLNMESLMKIINTSVTYFHNTLIINNIENEKYINETSQLIIELNKFNNSEILKSLIRSLEQNFLIFEEYIKKLVELLIKKGVSESDINYITVD